MDARELEDFINAILVAVHQGDDPLEAVLPDVLVEFQESGDVYQWVGEKPATVVATGGKRYRVIVEEMP